MELWFELNLMENLFTSLIIIYMSNDPFTKIHTKYSYSMHHALYCVMYNEKYLVMPDITRINFLIN